MRTHNITSIEAMLALLEQSLLDVGHVKTLAQHAMNAERPLQGSPSLRQDASGNIGFGTPPAPTSAARLLALYERGLHEMPLATWELFLIKVGQQKVAKFNGAGK
jgi:hypothetical protein